MLTTARLRGRAASSGRAGGSARGGRPETGEGLVKIGIDQYSVHHLPELTGIAMLEFAREYGLQGAQFKDLHQVSPTLDIGELGATRDFAREHGFYLEIGIPSPNPNRNDPVLLADGDGDPVAGLRRHLELIAPLCVDSRAVRCFVGGPGDRGKPGRSMALQIEDTLAVARELAPVLRALDLKLAFENHADITTHEAVDIVLRLGPDISGICLDTGNIPITLEEPLAAARRAAPYTIATHMKDAVIVFTDRGLTLNPRALGEGALPIREIFEVLWRANPDLMISVEDHGRLFPMPIFESDCIALYPDVSAGELAQLVRIARQCERQIGAGALASPDALERLGWPELASERLRQGALHAHELLAGLAGAGQRTED
jgi:sugar phosphate isomerase/epimerase